MAVSQSEVHANLNRDKVLNDTWWLYYCCCGGVGFGPVGDPLIGGETKELCLRSMCTTTDMAGPEGLCSGISVMLCITQMSSLPPMQGQPKFVCCNAGKKDAKITYKTNLFDYKQIFDETFWLYYCFCAGCGVNKPGVGRPYVAAQEKFLIVKGSMNLEAPIVDGTWCSSVGTELCLWSQCQFPPAPNAPKIKCFNMPKGKGSSGATATEDSMSIGKPQQVEMA